MKRSVAKYLPPGWIKEIVKRKRGEKIRYMTVLTPNLPLLRFSHIGFIVCLFSLLFSGSAATCSYSGSSVILPVLH